MKRGIKFRVDDVAGEMCAARPRGARRRGGCRCWRTSRCAGAPSQRHNPCSKRLRQRLNLEYDEPFSDFAFKFNLRRLTVLKPVLEAPMVSALEAGM